MTTTLRAAMPWGLAAALLGAATASAQTVDLTGVWRDETAQAADRDKPQKVAIGDSGASDGTVPAAHADMLHGSYVSLPYVEILRGRDQKLELFSDVGGIWAELAPVDGQTGVYDIVDRSPKTAGQHIGRLTTGGPDCGRRPDCLQFDAAAAARLGDPKAGAALYVPIDPYDPSRDDDTLEQKFGDVFVPTDLNIIYSQLCYDLAGLNRVNVQESTGCRIDLFDMPKADSYSYWKVGHLAVPKGWSYASATAAATWSSVVTVDTGRELSHAESLDIGINASFNVLDIVDVKSSVSVATSETLDKLFETESVIATTQSVALNHALVLNRHYALLDEAFASRVRDLKGRAADDDAFAALIRDYGTHYANAVTYGARGSRTLTLDSKTIRTLHEKGANIAAGLTVEVAGEGGGVNANHGSTDRDIINSVVSRENRDAFCYGGGACSEDGVPSGDVHVPIFLDLRPLSDLLAPPFFGDAEIYGPVRRTLADAIAKRTYVRRDDLDRPTMTAVVAVNPTVDPLQNPTSARADRPLLLCGEKAVSRRADPSARSVLQEQYCCAPQNVPLRDPSTPVVAAISFKGAAPVARPADAQAPFSSVDLGAGVRVDLPIETDPAPFVSGVTVDYEFLSSREDRDRPAIHRPDLDAYCLKRFGDGWTGTPLATQGASCRSGSAAQTIDLDQLCRDQHGDASGAAWSEVAQAWSCTFQMTLPVDATAWCAMRYGPGSEFVESGNAFAFSWDCAPGGRLAYQDLNGICQTMAGRTFNTVQAGMSGATDAEGRFLCTGRFVGVHTAAAADASLRTYPELAPYDPKAAPAGATVNVVAPLEWTGDASAMCKGVDLDLVIGLQTVPADALIAGR